MSIWGLKIVLSLCVISNFLVSSWGSQPSGALPGFTCELSDRDTGLLCSWSLLLASDEKVTPWGLQPGGLTLGRGCLLPLIWDVGAPFVLSLLALS